MSRKQDTFYDYNIYQVPLDKVEDLQAYLLDRKFEEIELKNELIINANGFSFILFFCDKDNLKGSPWIKILDSCTNYDLAHQLKIYGAALICTSQTDCFVVSYGNAHFYISSYCAYGFGISVAERLIDLDYVRAQQNVSHGGKLNKTYLDYISGASLAYRSAEIPTYIRGHSIDAETWGEIINCGVSAQFKWKEKPLSIGLKLEVLAEILKKDVAYPLPRLMPLDEEKHEEKIKELSRDLAKAIDEYSEDSQNTNFVNIPSFSMVGTKIYQNDIVGYKLTCQRRRGEFEGEPSVSKIKEFLSENNQNIYEVINQINMTIEYGNDQWTPRKSLLHFIEFITNDNFCLREGKWYFFNQAFMQKILDDVSKIKFENHFDDEFAFKKRTLMQFACESGFNVNEERREYETYYNLMFAAKIGGKCIHPTTVRADEDADGRYKFEICDVVLSEELFFVKRGAPADFAGAVDQALITLEKIQSQQGDITIPVDQNIHPRTFSFIFIFSERKTAVDAWKDVFSLNLLIHLSELRYRLSSTDVTNLKVHFVYGD